ncbi:MAG TPA: hypothetical protein VFR58_07830 [Flavisolibacter sp.]|nr:hypothetical protein [Flavisolibacter sp.]
MKILAYSLFCIIAACQMPEERKPLPAAAPDTATFIQAADSNAAVMDSLAAPLPAPTPIRRPQGIYHAYIPFKTRMEQMVVFNRDLTFKLQETYFAGKKDSVVVTEGTWLPSDGYIWLYKDQLVRGRYAWKDDVLHYVSPLLQKQIPMQGAKDILENKTWVNRKNQGFSFFGIGNEPFWSISISVRDSLQFNLADWSQPLNLRLTGRTSSGDSLIFLAAADSQQLRLTILPYFCSDGMSDQVYPNKIRIEYNKQVYTGCGVLFRP